MYIHIQLFLNIYTCIYTYICIHIKWLHIQDTPYKTLRSHDVARYCYCPNYHCISVLHIFSQHITANSHCTLLLHVTASMFLLDITDDILLLLLQGIGRIRHWWWRLDGGCVDFLGPSLPILPALTSWCS